VRGIILAGGTGSRLHPATLVVSKQLLPVFDKPMVYYPLSVLLAAGVREILLITTPRDRAQFESLLGDGSRFGATLAYATQDSPRGIPEALEIARRFTGSERVALILGDNLFHGDEVTVMLAAARDGAGAHIAACRVPNPEQYGVVELDAGGHAIAITEKPTNGKSRWAIPGLYVFPPRAWTRVKSLAASTRGELEITDLLRHYATRGALTVHRLGGRTKWLDTGTPASLLAASKFVSRLQQRLGLPVGSPEYAATVAGSVTRAATLRQLRLQKGDYALLVARALADKRVQRGRHA
jgi:glucose-1-phosphate thymidylyltransferase